MSQDASFEDGVDRPLRLWAQDAEDLGVISALCQDAIFPVTEMAFRAKNRSFAVLLNRFRWEDDAVRGTDFERVQATLEFSDVTSVRSQGIDRADKDVVLSVLSIEWAAGEDGVGTATLNLAGDGAIALACECIDVRLTDVTRPYLAPSRKAPSHDLSSDS